MSFAPPLPRGYNARYYFILLPLKLQYVLSSAETMFAQSVNIQCYTVVRDHYALRTALTY